MLTKFRTAPSSLISAATLMVFVVSVCSYVVSLSFLWHYSKLRVAETTATVVDYESHNTEELSIALVERCLKIA